MLPGSGVGPEAVRLPHVLLVEDDVMIRAMLGEELRQNGVRVVEAGNADEAWNYLQAGGAADLVFSDIQMPGSMDGFELADRIRTQFPSLKIILTSGNPGPRNLAGSSIFISKPYGIEKATKLALEAIGLNT
jgi:CheY-like chemotaxis protein